MNNSVESDSVRAVYKVVTEKIRSDPRIQDTITYIGVEIAEKK